MSSQPTLTTLPWVIVEQIIHHITNDGLYCQNIAELSNRRKVRLLLLLLPLCSSWKHLVTERLLREAVIYIDRKTSWQSCMFPNFPEAETEFTQNTLRLVKCAQVNVHIEDIISGFASKWLERFVEQKLVFSRAADVQIHVEEDNWSDETVDSSSQSKLHVFVQKLFELFPAAANVGMELYHSCESLDNEYMACRNELAGLLKQRVSEFQLGIAIKEPRHVLPLNVLTGLSTISCLWEAGSEQTYALIRNNAATLVELNICFVDNPGESILSLVIGNYSEMVCYPQLLKIGLETYNDFDHEHKPICPPGIPFPVLERVDLKMEYPFGDHALFRQNCNNLKYLGIVIDGNVLDILNNCGILEHGGFKNMQHVKVHEITSTTTSREIIDPLARFAHTVSKTIKVIELDTSPAPNFILQALSIKSNTFAELHTLAIPTERLALSDIIVLLKRLPQLSDIHSKFNGLGSEYSKIPVKKLINKLCNSYYPLSQYFKCWRLKYTINIDLDAAVVACNVALCIMCPQFSFIVVDPHDRRMFNRLVEAELADGPLSEYKDYLRPLVVFW